VQGGKSLAEALAQHKFFPPLYVNMIRAGELGGFLEVVLQRLAEYLDSSQSLRDEVRSALTYPILLTFSMGGSMIILLTYVLPKFATLFTDMGRALPLPARIVLGASDLLRGYWWLGLLVIAGVVGGVRYSIRSPRGRYNWDQWKLRIPGLGLLLKKTEVAGLARTLGTLLKSGVPLLQALGVLKQIAGNQVIVRALGEVETGVKGGEGVSGPLGRSGVFPPLAVQMMAVGEETGRLDELLLRVADHYDREVRVQVDQFTRLLEPVLILVMGLGTGFIVISMLSAIFSVNDLPM
jgi:general secretion pathway protein F